jgi:hypothetical protein
VGEPHDDRELAEKTSAALHDLRLAVRGRVLVPPSADLRRRVEHTGRLRYAGAAVAAAAVAAVVLVAAWQLPNGRDGAANHRPTPLPSETVRKAPPVTDRSITGVKFDDLTLQMGPNPDVPCASGPVHITRDGETPVDFVGDPSPVFADVDRDGRLDAIVPAGCYPADGDPTEQLLIISPGADGALTGRWAGPVTQLPGRRATLGPYVAVWVTDGVLYADIRPPEPGPDYVPGQVHAYVWTTAGRLMEVTQSRYPALLPTRSSPAPAVRPGPLADALDCPGGTVRFGADGTATVDTARYDTTMPPEPSWFDPPRSYDPAPTKLRATPRWVDLAGRRLLLARINCTGPGGTSAGAVAVLAPDGGGLTVIDATRIDGPADAAWHYWVARADGADALYVTVAAAGQKAPKKWIWDGGHFQAQS